VDGTPATEQRLQRIEEGFLRIEQILNALVERESVKDWYSTEEFAHAVGRAEFTVREWCRLGRIRAQKRGSGRGPLAAWVISHDELQRYRREGLLRTPPV
jgi:hypothetical protein